MNQILAGAVGLSLAIVLWSLGKNPLKRLQTSQMGYLQKSLHRTNQLSLVKSDERESIQEHATTPKNQWQPPKSPKDRLSLERKLQKLIKGGPDARLEAIRLAKKWGHSRGLPILRRGLKDVDPRVVIEAAAAIQKHRISINRTQLRNQELDSLWPPRNVALMR